MEEPSKKLLHRVEEINKSKILLKEPGIGEERSRIIVEKTLLRQKGLERNLFSLAKHTLLPLAFDEIEKRARIEASEGRSNEWQIKLKFIDFYQKLENDNDSICTEYSQAYHID